MMTPVAAGVDVGRNWLDVAVAPSGRSFKAPDALSGIAVIEDRLTRLGVTRVVLGSIGAYGVRLVRALAAAPGSAGSTNAVAPWPTASPSRASCSKSPRSAPLRSAAKPSKWSSSGSRSPTANAATAAKTLSEERPCRDHRQAAPRSLAGPGHQSLAQARSTSPSSPARARSAPRGSRRRRRRGGWRAAGVSTGCRRLQSPFPPRLRDRCIDINA